MYFEYLDSIQIADEISKLGPVFRQYKEVFKDNGLNGKTLLAIRERDLKFYFNNIGITNEYYLNEIIFLLKDLRQQHYSYEFWYGFMLFSTLGLSKICLPWLNKESAFLEFQINSYPVKIS